MTDDRPDCRNIRPIYIDLDKNQAVGSKYANYAEILLQRMSS